MSVEVGKGKKKRKVPKTYVPPSLTKEDRKKQVESLVKGTRRPKVESFKTKRSVHVVAFEKKYNRKITDKQFI